MRAPARLVALIASILDVRDLFVFGGIAAICYGVAQIYQPAAWIVGGIVFCSIGLRR
jgi:uncharacterized membrane protein YtjA (UPF0391 family)